ncbi:hypothetical protein [Alcanivorax sp.]|uniref:hypothetical protein n=1 Tax=Alcanivorax sp. TaxID=1872427 RepID=UPI0019CA7FDA|nr:hypothetical protein [Alcanivorax sp.]MBD3645535.1 hypothetical protein [Alcanivorax sp.]
MRYFHALFLVVLVMPLLANAEEGKGNDDEAKMISGMSVLGNKDAPKSLYIVPWKSSEIGVETDLTSSLLDEEMVPVDKPVFMRELDFYQVSTEK